MYAHTAVGDIDRLGLNLGTLYRIEAALAGVLAMGLCGCNAPRDQTPPGRLGCTLGACHARVEHVHYGGDPLDCVDCHGGNRDATSKSAAHVTTSVSFNPSSPGGQLPGGRILRGAPLAELDELDPAVLQFLNPSDYRVAARTCGSPTRGGGNCHTRILETSELSAHATLSGQLAGGLYFGGLTDREARFAVRDVVDDYPVDVRGTTASLTRLPGDAAGTTPTGETASAYFGTMGQLCVECHLSRDGTDVPGKYTSSGCDACHLLTENDGRPRTADPTQERGESGHGALHRLTLLIPDSQCNHCHHAHLHRGLLSQGVRERSEPEGDTRMGGVNRGVEDPENVVFWPESNYVRHRGAYNLYGKPFPFYIEDEDGTNDVDETPPDIHFSRGLACIDCHVVAELHGTNHMAVRREFETRVRCESCHGTPAARITDSRGMFRVSLSRTGSAARNVDAITLDDEGEFTQYGKLDQRQHHVTQIAQRVDPTEARFNPRTLMGCGLHAGDAEFRARLLAWFRSVDPSEVAATFPGMPDGGTLPDDLGSRRGRMECFGCHNAWTVNCFGCHVVRDDRQSALNQVTGVMQVGRVSNYGMSVVSDALILGFDTQGRISPMVGTSIFFTHIDASGRTLVDAAPLLTQDGFSGDGNEHNPVHHHTIQRQPRDCQGCHPRADGVADDENALKRAIGFGTGEFIFVDGSGQRHVLDRIVALDFDGDGIYDDPVTTPLGAAAQAASPVAASTHMSIAEPPTIQPGPLDLETINRILRNHVVPQRP
ncbi:MAG: hypothetical protein GXP55_04245 [Deltaproteobacteria bacterium]|nr:hypothetical protein [Deltaproteobacteria bacterium]